MNQGVPLEKVEFEYGKLIHGLSYEQYAAQAGLRSWHLKAIKDSPAHLQVRMREEKKETPAMREGKLFHSAVENGEKFLKMMHVMPVFTSPNDKGEDSTRTKKAKQLRAEWQLSLPKGSFMVTQSEADMLAGMLEAISNHPLVGKLIRDGVRETSLWVKDPETGLVLMCRPDLIHPSGYFIDWKTTRDARKQFFENQIFSDNWDNPFYILNAAHYVHCAKVAGLLEEDEFTFIAIEKEPPYGINTFPMDQGCLAPGEEWRAHLTRKYAECKKTGKWHCYSPRPQQTVPPQWVSLPPQEGVSR